MVKRAAGAGPQNNVQSADLQPQLMQGLRDALVEAQIDAVPHYEAGDPSVEDDEIVFRTRDGGSVYPVTIQVGTGVETAGRVSTNLLHYDGAGELESVTHGRERRVGNIRAIALDLVTLIRKHQPAARVLESAAG